MFHRTPKRNKAEPQKKKPAAKNQSQFVPPQDADVEQILMLQRLAGNRATLALLAAGSIQRALSKEAKAKDLQSPQFAADDRLQAAYDNEIFIAFGARGYHVEVIQQALIDDGFEMPISTAKGGSPDGIFGKETRKAVKAFQKKYGLAPDGVLGRKTLGKMDELAMGSAAPSPKAEATEPQTEPQASESPTMEIVIDDNTPLAKAWDKLYLPPEAGESGVTVEEFNRLAQTIKDLDLGPEIGTRLHQPDFWKRVKELGGGPSALDTVIIEEYSVQRGYPQEAVVGSLIQLQQIVAVEGIVQQLGRDAALQVPQFWDSIRKQGGGNKSIEQFKSEVTDYVQQEMMKQYYGTEGEAEADHQGKEGSEQAS